jgi:RNA-binding protein 39
VNCRRFREKKEAAEPEADPERDQRTVFAYQVNWLVIWII